MLKQLKSDAATLDTDTIFCKSARKENTFGGKYNTAVGKVLDVHMDRQNRRRGSSRERDVE